jgi:hypothetical protein
MTISLVFKMAATKLSPRLNRARTQVEKYHPQREALSLAPWLQPGDYYATLKGEPF